MADTEALAGLLERCGDLVMPLTRSPVCNEAAAELLQRSLPAALFPAARSSQGAVSGLLLLLDCWEASHQASQELTTVEGSYWHAIAHRMEPDSFNAAYWFRRVGRHPIFPALHEGTEEILRHTQAPGWKLAPQWEPVLFIEWCEEARRHGESAPLQAALAIQKLEWNLLFAWCRDPAA